ncbi:glycosyltransferase family 2 protein [Cereibacter sphaeroides]|uniref:glycosyltransferase family 2 protein n=1 Tax=Cereibacter sphaeroides TaxID=1063 RepID=UPI001F409152|nr:glycosyltransferase family 2 protein [Cereibacter sphaeroides]MCE6967238.1 glycosyltransferase [Cereibacter sphaeroides]
MSVSFIVTSYNIAPYIGQCLDSLRPCLRPGDQLVLVDDGSTDETVEMVERMAAGGFGHDIEWTPVWLGTNTIGGVGIPGNIGLNHVRRDTVFFVDGDDYLLPEAFLRARADYEANPTDIRFTDYLEYDDQKRQTKAPADAHRWAGLNRAMSPKETQLAALGLIAVPWRKFYRTEFLRRHRICYPEGDFFFEDNPFHWQVCTLAQSIAFSRIVVCHHRINRPGQTMASTGLELAAFFTHFRTIMSMLPAGRADLRQQAVRWLLGNMSWHVERLKPQALFGYAREAHAAVKLVSDADWDAISSEMATTAIWHQATRLRVGGLWEVVEAWRREALSGEQTRMLCSLDSRLRELLREVRASRHILDAQRAVEEFEALKGLMSAQSSIRDLSEDGYHG